MTLPSRSRQHRHWPTSWRYAMAALALGVGVAAATGSGVAWAGEGSPDTAAGSVGHAGPAKAGASPDSSPQDTSTAKESADNEGTEPQAPVSTAPTGAPAGIGADEDPESGPSADLESGDADDPAGAEAAEIPAAEPAVDPAESTSTPEESPASSESADPDVVDTPAASRDAAPTAPAATDSPTTTPDVAQSDSAAARPAFLVAAPSGHRSAALATVTLDLPASAPAAAVATLAPTPASVAGAQAADATLSTAAVVTTPTIAPPKPKPLSPIARLLQLPGRIINAVLQVFDITVDAHGPRAPISLAPINDLLFAAFRGLENLFGLHKPPAVQPVIPTLTYTGPTTRLTPTVAQFLNASAAEYVLGGVPGGLKPFTVNGWQMSTTKYWSGAAARAWVTPDNQIIIAYQGTTGGTNLLFKPLMAVSQLLADLQVIFTKTTPQAFYDSLNFARRVQAEALKQGYGADDIFVTGHSLGGWEAQYVAQQTGLAGIGFEGPGLNTTVPGNGADSMFVNIETYGDAAAYMSTDLPAMQPFMPPYVPGGGAKPHYGSIVMIGDPDAATPLRNASARLGRGLISSIVFMVDFIGNFLQHHLPGVQAHYLDVTPDPGVVPWLGTTRGPVNKGYGNLTIPQLKKAASDAGTLIQP